MPKSSSREAPRTLEPEARRGAILAAAAEVFADKGFHTARISDVALKAGVAQGTIYRFFSSKEELATSVLANGVQFLCDLADRAAEEAERRGDRSLGIELFVAKAAEVYVRHRSELLALHAWSLDPSSREYTTDLEAPLVARLRALLDAARPRLWRVRGVDLARLVPLLLYSLAQLEQYGAASSTMVKRLVDKVIFESGQGASR
jgi:AcrR family transcriptional regulator